LYRSACPAGTWVCTILTSVPFSLATNLSSRSDGGASAGHSFVFHSWTIRRAFWSRRNFRRPW
jgi:hypothetical protein